MRASRRTRPATRSRCGCPARSKPEIVPPTAAHVLAVHALLPPRYRLPLLVLDATGMRLGELERLTWGDVDEPRQRWRVSQAVSKTGRARWVDRPDRRSSRPCCELVPRDDRVPERRVFQGFGGDRFRTAIDPCLHRRRRPGVLAPRPPPPPDLAPASRAAIPGRGSASTSASATSPSPRTPTRTCSPTKPSSTTPACSNRSENETNAPGRAHVVLSPVLSSASKTSRFAGMFDSCQAHLYSTRPAYARTYRRRPRLAMSEIGVAATGS